jgi:plastocyanin domain-containing protein
MILRLPKKAFLTRVQRENRVTKIVMNKTDQVEWRELKPGEYTYAVNMAPYSEVQVYASTDNCATLTVQGCLYEHDSSYSRDGDKWQDIESISVDKATSPQAIILNKGSHGYSLFRVANKTDSTANVNQIEFVGIGTDFAR